MQLLLTLVLSIFLWLHVLRLNDALVQALRNLGFNGLAWLCNVLQLLAFHPDNFAPIYFLLKVLFWKLCLLKLVGWLLVWIWRHVWVIFVVQMGWRVYTYAKHYKWGLGLQRQWFPRMPILRYSILFGLWKGLVNWICSATHLTRCVTWVYTWSRRLEMLVRSLKHLWLLLPRLCMELGYVMLAYHALAVFVGQGWALAAAVTAALGLACRTMKAIRAPGRRNRPFDSKN